MPENKKNAFDEKLNQEQSFNLEFSEPLDEHSVEERERAQRTGDENNYDTKNSSSKYNKK
ncbi:hypothetical protein [Sporolactobacillus spathodeae]|uniref:YfhD family protein n=1 Tax=Sporolactobacillus spathodeae TaxID=1465502 RepID=A0ABS2Q8Y8_9BACL|nr:hypothetical protein [Sporolactobacillus spathodeae]MBM7657639.1 hypothetical protein [Sporolactobacillus spathodeae]